MKNNYDLQEIKDNLAKLFYGAIKVLVHVTVLSISALLTINMFRSFSSIPLYKTLWTILGITIECGKVYLWVLSVALFRRNFDKDRVVATLIMIVYIGLAIVSYTANSGFTLQSIKEQSFTANVQNASSSTSLIDREVIQLEEDIKFLNANRELAQAKKKALPDNWSTKEQDIIIDETTSKISAKNTRINEILLEKKGISETGKVRESSSEDIFTLLGEGKVSGDKIMLLLMRFIALLLEALTIITAGRYPLKVKRARASDSEEEVISISIEDKEDTVVQSVVESESILPVQESVSYKVDVESFTTYVKSLMSNGRESLRSDIEVSEDTGLKLSHCKSFRRSLSQMSYNDMPLIQGKRGVGSWANYPCRSIIKLIEKDLKVKK